LNSDGTLDRKSFGQFIFSNAENVAQLNSLLHPLIKDITINLSSNQNIIYMINAPVLFEAGFNTFMDTIIIVSAYQEQSIERGKKRDGLSQREIIDRLSHQILLKEKIKNADYLIDNSGSIENTRKQAEEIWNNLKISSQKIHK